MREEKSREEKSREDESAFDPSSSPPQPPKDDDPLVQRLTRHDITYDLAYKLLSGNEPMAKAWLDYVDTHPGIPNAGAYLTKYIRLKKPPPTNSAGPPGASPPRVTGLSEADLEWQHEHQRAETAQTAAKARAGPAPPA
jgi:hypothetical protein